MDKHFVAHILEEIAFLLEVQGENAFKVRAYQNAARAIEGLDEKIETLIEEQRLLEVPGIGEGIAEKITTLVKKGKLPYYENLKKATPVGLIELMTVSGLGAKKVKKVYEELHIETIEDLVDACKKGKISALKGFGAKTEENILRGIEKLKAYGKRLLWWDACKLALPVLEELTVLKEVKRADVAGSFRRKMETVGDLDFLVSSSNPGPVMDWFTSQPLVETVQSKGKTKSSVRLIGGIQADLRVVSDAQYASALIYFTGSKSFNINLRKRANDMGYTLSEYGLKPLKGVRKKEVVCKTENDLFKALKLAYIPPELREGYLEIEASERGELPKLVEPGDIQGVFHCHTTDSDGHNTIDEMAAAAEEFGWEYMGISDHSKSSFQASGMDEERLFAQIEKIAKLNRSKKFSVHLFSGLECDILKDGSLDFPDEILKKLDFVIVSIHSAFKLDEKKMTARLIKAIENPHTTMVGHPTGRLLLKRDPYPLDIPKVIDACIANHTIIELNANPMRLDMDWRFWHRAAEKGLMCSINPDAHSISNLDFYLAGINAARKGWLEKGTILNTFSLDRVKKILKERKP